MTAPLVWRVTGLILTFLVLAAVWWFGSQVTAYIWPEAVRFFDVIAGALSGCILFELFLRWFR